MAKGGLRGMTNVGFAKQKLNPNESENTLDFEFSKKIIGI